MKSISRCPYCGKEMHLGFIHQDRRALKWIPEEKDKGPFLQMFSKGIKLTDSLTTSSVEAFYCKDCEKIVIDLEGNTR
ncbi:hypothetical protein EUAN_19920 [Andreesenia angusta]|uniref:DUF6487 domain-containing protein n=1 Tax=Andreesenia angusta TaxID=39480 RepID=A0A1S1V506_9FIRM|nr:PF20097 family protein [Andreesenia angusta]OHW61672.1 hypothetical protein EUAN_19920 [Andreesenia angusta]